MFRIHWGSLRIPRTIAALTFGKAGMVYFCGAGEPAVALPQRCGSISGPGVPEVLCGMQWQLK